MRDGVQALMQQEFKIEGVSFAVPVVRFVAQYWQRLPLWKMDSHCVVAEAEGSSSNCGKTHDGRQNGSVAELSQTVEA
jgi:hypothetical protein